MAVKKPAKKRSTKTKKPGKTKKAGPAEAVAAPSGTAEIEEREDLRVKS